MKKIVLVVALLGVAAFAACGGGGSTGTCTGTGLEQAELSGDEFVTIVESCLSNIAAQTVAKAQVTLCDCPGGGTVTADDQTGVATLNTCKSADGYTFSGTMTVDMVTGVASVDLATFGCCTGVTGDNIQGDPDIGCSGTITGVCGGTQLTCTLAAPVGGEDSCDFTCQ